MGDNTGNKRQFDRVKEELTIKLFLKFDKGLNFKQIDGKTIDVSAAGMLIHMNEQLNPGDIINIHFLKPNSFEMLSLNSKVIRSVLENSFYETAVEFIEMTEHDKQKLNYYLTK